MGIAGLLSLFLIAGAFIRTGAQCPVTSVICDYSNAVLVCGNGNEFCGFYDCSYNCDTTTCIFGNGACGCLLSTPVSNCGAAGFYQDYSTCTYQCSTSPNPTPSSTPTSNPTPSSTTTPTLNPTPSSTPTPTSNSTPSSTTTPPLTLSGCIAANQSVLTQQNNLKLIKDLVLGDKVLTENGFQDYMGNIHQGGVYPTIIIYVENGSSIELTYDHYIKTTNGFVHAQKVSIGDLIKTRYGNKKIINIKNETSYVSSPFTRSGTIIVNNIVLSCYANDRSHNIVNFVFFPVRTGLVKHVDKYFEKLVYVFNMLPFWAKSYISMQTP